MRRGRPRHARVADYDGDGEDELRVDVAITYYTDSSSRSGAGASAGEASFARFFQPTLQLQGSVELASSWEDTEGGEPERTEMAAIAFEDIDADGFRELVRRGATVSALCDQPIDADTPASDPDELDRSEDSWLCSVERFEQVHVYDPSTDQWLRPR